ncbi:MAG: hypothetical protein ABSA34_02355 [Candidatus Goldiibacteriota bacterium]|jgi:hypothetical protein
MKKKNIFILIIQALLIAAAVQVYAHEHKAPHSGVLVECGEEFAHIELLNDPESGKLTAYVLDGEAENPVRLRQGSIKLKIKAGGKDILLALKAVANPLTGETVGDTSEFSAVSEKLKGTAGFTGQVTLIKINGETFRNLAFSYPVAAAEKSK